MLKYIFSIVALAAVTLGPILYSTPSASAARIKRGPALESMTFKQNVAAYVLAQYN